MLARHERATAAFGLDVARAFAINAVSTVLSFVIAVMLARLLGADGYGVYAFAWALVALLATPAQAGLPMLVIRETARGIADDRPELVRGVWLWTGRVAAVLSVVIAVVAAAVIAFQYTPPFGVQAQAIAWGLALVPLIALGNLRGAALRGLKRVVAGQLPEFIVRPALLVALLAVAMLSDTRVTPPGAMALHVIAAAVAFVAGAWLLARAAPANVRIAAPAMDTRRWLASTLPLALIAGVQVVNLHADVLMLGIFRPPDQVGMYRVAAQLALLAAFGLAAVNMVIGPRFAELHARGEMAQLQRLVTASSRVQLAFSVAVTLAFVVVGKPLLQAVFGDAFAGSFVPLLILLVGQLVNSAAGSVGYLLNMTGYERETAKGVAAAAVMNVVLNLVLIPKWGMHGAAVATASSMVVWNLLLWHAARRRIGINSFAFNTLTRVER